MMTIPIGSLGLDAEKTRATMSRLLLAKQLFLHGMDHSEKAGPLNKMIAIHNLHNAVEIVLRAVFLHFEIRAEKELNIGFEDMLKEIDQHSDFKTRKIKLPYRQEMRNLNQVRNLVQHHATEPPSSTVEESRVFVRRFLIQTYQTFFGCDFETVTLISMVDDEHLQKLLEASSLEIAAGNIKKSLTLASAAFNWANSTIGEVLPDVGWPFRFNELRDFKRNLENVLDGLLRSVNDRPFQLQMMGGRGGAFADLDRLEDRLDASFQHVQRRSAHYSALLASGIDLVDYRRFHNCVGILTFSSASSTGGPTTRTIHVSWGGKSPTEQDALWVHNFVVNAIVQWQVLGLAPRVDDSMKGEAQRLLDWGDDVIVG